VKKIVNRSVFDEVMPKILLVPFFPGHGVYSASCNYTILPCSVSLIECLNLSTVRVRDLYVPHYAFMRYVTQCSVTTSSHSPSSIRRLPRALQRVSLIRERTCRDDEFGLSLQTKRPSTKPPHAPKSQSTFILLWMYHALKAKYGSKITMYRPIVYLHKTLQ